ncbi:MAG TPA: D-tagatose-bisphosphate aldolase, class II, non-catalytic subunit [Pontiellaceae bacterium]|nr:D-tagatose-bisphosphate aldolase, class II, non-catalytic subunit [Pontiellaceae bacterium]HPR82236.1 D-tagatose-bisphosphate aldolase, class II, non-catalytic subunit [Pontiellaceae bacterium]
MSAIEKFVQILQDNRAGKATGIYSICSAQETVLQASMLQAKKDGSILLIESTSNQVDQFGGYTGMKPADFVAYVRGIAASVGFDAQNLLLGGDHLGPNAWQKEPAASAMAKAHDLIREYVKAGYQKIHLDASMFLADDQGDRHKALANEIVAERAAALCKTAEETHAKYCAGQPKPVYIIGTEVPIPGGAQEAEETVTPTSPADAVQTIEVTRAAFEKAGLTEAWNRVCGVVVQPGVEFGDDQVFHYQRSKARGLSEKIMQFDRFVYEAHSTDYQSETGLTQLVEDHFCILKVGPWVTFGYREALFALAQIEEELLAPKGLQTSRLREVIDAVMVEDTKYWAKYYPGNATEQAYKRKYSFSDRSRYYWPNPRITAAKAQLVANLKAHPVPLSLLSQYMPGQYRAVSEGLIRNDVEEIIIHRTQDVISLYARACNMARR